MSTFKFGHALDTDPESSNAVQRALQAAGGIEVNDASWDILWYGGLSPPSDIYRNLGSRQRINHIPGISVIANKLKLAETVDRYVQSVNAQPGNNSGENIAPFHPVSWELRSNRQKIEAAITRDPRQKWLLKPAMGRWGKSIRFVSAAADLPLHGDWIVQRYVTSPMLIDSRKFSMRRWLLILCCDPVIAYLYGGGMLSIATDFYRETSFGDGDRFRHIVNAGVQQHHPDYDIRKNRIPMRQWLDGLGNQQHAADIEASVTTAVTSLMRAARETLLSTASRLLPHGATCFELIGLDIIVDQSCTAWIIECNRSPWMGYADPGTTKGEMLQSLIELVNLTRTEVVEKDYRYPDRHGDFNQIYI